MLRIALRTTDGEYEGDLWRRCAGYIEAAKVKAQTRATKTGQEQLVWKTRDSAIVVLIGRRLGLLH